MSQVKAPTLVAELMTDEPMQGSTPANADNLSVGGKQLASIAEEPTVFIP